MTLAWKATDDEVRVGKVLRDKEQCRLDHGMASLDDLLRVRKIMPHEDVDIRRFVALVESHEILLQWTNNGFNLMLQVYVGLADL